MSKAAAAHVFIDANTALHFRRPDQVDWCALTGATRVILVAAPILHRELEEQKVHNPSRRLRERASSYVKWLATFVRNPELPVRARTSWHFVPTEPQLNFPGHGLSPSIADDHLIASVIAYEAPADDRILVATADVGLEVKLRHRRIAPLLLPEDLRLPEEPDPREKELLDLRRQVARQRDPKLTLLTGSDGGPYEIRVAVERDCPSAPSLADMRHQHPLLHDERSGPVVGDDPVSQAMRLASFQALWLTPERIASFNRQLEECFRQYAIFLDALAVWERQAALTVPVVLSLRNEGTAPASDVDVLLEFPADLIVMRKDDLPTQPERPTPPERPAAGLHGIFARPDLPGLRDPFWHRPIADMDIARTVNAHDAQVNFWLKNLKHGFTEQLETVYVRFPDRQAVRSFNVGYTVSAAELPQELSGRIHFVIA